MNRADSISMRSLAWMAAAALSVGIPAAAAVPDEVGGLTIDPSSTLSWNPAAGADDYNVYRGSLLQFAAGTPPRCHGDEVAATSFASPDDPPPGDGFLYLVSGESDLDGEGPLGTDSNGGPRASLGACDEVVRHHLLLRLGYGGDEWTRERIDTLGLQGYIDEQLAPETIDESTNTALNDRTAGLVPPANINELLGLDIVNGVYARRQLEQQAAMFWQNHFNTEYRKVLQFFNNRPGLSEEQAAIEAAGKQFDELERFRDDAFNANFRQIVEDSALSVAMLIYLDSIDNVAAEPNENYARELLELHTMGVDNGYTQTDIEQLARALTGWNVCKKQPPDVGDVLAPCIPRVLEAVTPGEYVANFRTTEHDTGVKTLFAGTPYETVIGPNATPEDGVNDLFDALDAIAAHPSTPQFISTKLLERFAVESPPATLVDQVVAEWNDAGNPRGTGDLREVLRAVVDAPEFRSPDAAGNKIKTPFEHLISIFRVARGDTNGTTAARRYLRALQHVPHNNPVPTGYPERGGDWIDTNGMLSRQNLGLDLVRSTLPGNTVDVIGLMADNGLTSASPPGDIVDFWASLLFGGALTAAERQEAIDYLTTDDTGAPAPVDDDRVRETVGFMLGYAQFLEQ